MSKRAEDAALKAYPERVLTDEYGFKEDCNLSLRIGYTEGYEQAEKDLALTWEDIREIYKIFYLLFMEKRCISEAFEPKEERYKEALRRFNEQKNK